MRDPRFPTAKNSRNVVASDDEEITPPFHAIYVGHGGDVVLVNEAGTEVLWPNVQNGTYIESSGKKIMVRGTTGLAHGATTTASGFVACWLE